MGKEIYTKETKLSAVRYVLEGHSIAQTARDFQISKTPIEKWVNAYRVHGEEGLESRNLVGRQGGFDDEFRLKVVRYKESRQLSSTQTAAFFNLDVATVCRWWKNYQEKGVDGLAAMRNPKKKDSGKTTD